MTESKLTHEAKAAIRKYMLSLIALPGILTAILGFAFGYLVNDVAKEKAYNDAYRQASGLILELYDEISSMKSKAEEAEEKTALAMDDAITVAKDIRILKKGLVSVQMEAESIRKKLKTAESFQRADEIIEGVTQSLVERDDFSKILVSTANESIANCEFGLATNRKRLKENTKSILGIQNSIKEMKESIINLSSKTDKIENSISDTGTFIPSSSSPFGTTGDKPFSDILNNPDYLDPRSDLSKRLEELLKDDASNALEEYLKETDIKTE